MINSERLERFKERKYYENGEAESFDDITADRIRKLLNHVGIDQYCLVDAFYYDFSAIPHAIQEKLNLCRDAYLLYGITTNGEIVSVWVDRWDLDSDDEIVDGKVIHKESEQDNNTTSNIPIIIHQSFNAKLLSCPCPASIFKLFGDSKRIDYE
jgi:hypothetical protein